MKKRKTLLCIVVCICILLAGCGQAQQEKSVALTFIHGWGGTGGTHARMQKFYETFDSKFPSISLNFQPSSDSAIAVAQANDMLAVDEMPNIVSTNGQSYYVNNAVKQKKALNLMPYIEKDQTLRDEIHPSVFDVWQTEDGALYTVPDALEVMGYWYNKSYFIQAGIVDVNGQAAIPKTWDEFYNACDKLTAWMQSSKNEKSIYALEKVQMTENLFLAKLAGNGEAGLAMSSAMPNTFDQPVFRDTVKDFAHILQYSNNTDSLDNARQFFLEGKTAMYFNGVWECEPILAMDDWSDIGYACYPTNQGKTLSYVSPSSGYVFYDSPDPAANDAEVAFLKYMLSIDVQTMMAQDTGQAPSNPNVDTKEISQSYPLLGNALETAHNADIQIKTISSAWSVPIMEHLSDQLTEACRDENSLDQMIESLNQITQGF